MGDPGPAGTCATPTAAPSSRLASVSGLPLMATPDPMGATSRGVGEVISAALHNAATGVVLAVGGSASTDSGAGALAALGARFLDRNGQALPDGGGALTQLADIDLTHLRPAPPHGFSVITDVDKFPARPDRGRSRLRSPEGRQARPHATARRGIGPARKAILRGPYDSQNGRGRRYGIWIPGGLRRSPPVGKLDARLTPRA